MRINRKFSPTGGGINKTLAAILLCLFCVALGLSHNPQAASAKGAGAAVSYQNLSVTGTVVGVGGRFGGRSRPFRLIINNYTSAGEIERLNSALQSGGQDQLLRVLSGMEAGRIQVGNNIGVPANAIISTPQGDGGSKITVIYQRDISFFELRYGTRSEDYRFGYAELYLRRNGRGEGTFIPAAQIRLRNGNTWEVEDFGVFPARLMGLVARGSLRIG
ncbi:MAG TPA: hypothetical protein VNA19_15100 [Pyrinomonadaceae bacterium]|nr:hypothetical protein [Pyrinomonadaceae bacterium]